MKRIVFTFRMVVILLCMMPLAVSAVTVEVKTAGTLEQVIDDSDEWSFKDLKIVGQLNAADILYLRTGTGRIATVENLDLAEVTVVSGGGAYATIQYSDNSVTMDNYKITFYSSDKNSKEVEMVSNMLGGNNYNITYYSNNLAGAFANKNYKTVTMPKTVKEIGALTFFQCKNLTSLVLTNPLEVIEERAFESCENLTDIDLSKVKTLGQGAFAGCEKLRGNAAGTINLSSLETIPDNAFGESSGDESNSYQMRHCSSIQHVLFSAKLKHIGRTAFYICTSLEDANLPEGLETIGDRAFYGCTSLATVTLPTTLQDINYDVFADTPWIQNLPTEDGILYMNTTAVRCVKKDSKPFSIVIREGTTTIAAKFIDEYYGYKASITSVTLPTTIRKIGASAFRNCSNLTSINLPEGLEEIGEDSWDVDDGAFAGTGLTTVTFPSTLKVIGYNAFGGCKDLTSFTNLALPEGLEVIGPNAFSYCTQITSVSFPESLRKIGNAAFYDCSSLVGEVTIPKGVKELGNFIFDGANLFRIVYLAENAVNIEYDSEAGSNSRMFNAERVTIGANVRVLPNGFFNSSTLLRKVTFEERTAASELTIGAYSFGSCEKLTTLTLPKGVMTIGEDAFIGTLSTIEFQGTVTSVGKEAFYRSDLTSISFPNGLVSVGDAAFRECENLASVNLGNSLKTIGESAFYSCSSLKTVTLPSTLQEIGNSCFASSSQLESVTCNMLTPLAGSSNVFDYWAYKNARLIVPAGKKAVYEATEPWSSFKNIEEMPFDGILGDANGDGKVTITDAVAVVDYILGNIPDDFSVQAADVNNDGHVNITDAVAIVDMILKQ